MFNLIDQRPQNTEGEVILICNPYSASIKIKQNIWMKKRACWKNKFVILLYDCEILKIERKHC